MQLTLLRMQESDSVHDLREVERTVVANMEKCPFGNSQVGRGERDSNRRVMQ